LYQEIDWDYWKSSCQDLGKEHDTNYRSTHPITNLIKPSSLPLDLAQEKNVSAEINNLRIAIRRLNYAIRTEKTYSDWVQKFLKFNRYKNQSEIDQKGVIKFLEYLAIDRKVAPKTQSVALNAVAFYFKHVLGREIGDISQFVRAKPRVKLPIIMTRDEVSLMLNNLEGVQRLVTSLLYGAGLRIMEAIRLRVQDIDFGFNQIIVRDAKGNKERAVPLPAKLIQSMKDHLTEVKRQHSEDLDQGLGRVYMPHTLVLKYGKSDQQWVWQYAFPSPHFSPG
jgi:site-specific recombinase XerD